METFTQPKIAGYRQLREREVALMNEVKALAEQCGELVSKLRMHLPSPNSGPDMVHGPCMLDPLGQHGPHPTIDQRWISIGATDLQRGFMAIVRGIAQPTTF